MKTALVTGSAGFIGYHAAKRLLEEGWRVIGLDSLNDYYDVTLKEHRHADLGRHAHFDARINRLEAPGVLATLFATERPDLVLHLAAQAGVRHSIEAPQDYFDANLAGTFALLEAARAHPPAHMLLASTSSAYGANSVMPYCETDRADWQMSFYAATKKASESMAHSYAHLYGLPITMFRFFTVYGPWGRPDMALFKFTRAILDGTPIEVYNHGDMKRDFTYVDDLVEGIWRLIGAVPQRPASPDDIPKGDSLSPVAPFRVVNIGNGAPVQLMDFITAIEGALGRTAQKTMLPMQPGDVPATWADISLLRALTGFAPKTGIQSGVRNFTDWFRAYYEV